MVVRVDGKDYVVQRPHGSKANVRLADGSNHQCKRIYRPGTHRLETDLEMQTRVQERVTKLNAEQERAQTLSTRLTLGSPALSASASIILTTEVECADAGDRRQTASAAAEAVALQALAALGADSSDPMPDATPKVAGAEGYKHDPASFPGMSQAGPRCGWPMPPERANISAAQRSTRRPLPSPPPPRPPPRQQSCSRPTSFERAPGRRAPRRR